MLKRFSSFHKKRKKISQYIIKVNFRDANMAHYSLKIPRLSVINKLKLEQLYNCIYLVG